jgi:hypothetical protein
VIELERLWFVPSGASDGKLRCAYEADAGDPDLLGAAQAFTVTLDTVLLPQAPNGAWWRRLLQGQREVLIVSSATLGPNPRRSASTTSDPRPT